MEAPEQAESDDVAVSEQAEKEETAAPKQVEKEETAVPEQAEKEETGTAKAAEQAIPDQNDAGRSGAADSSVDTDTAANGEREEDSADVEEENPEEDEDSGMCCARRCGRLWLRAGSACLRPAHSLPRMWRRWLRPRRYAV